MAILNNHRVTNQTPPLSGYNAFRLNPLLLQIASGLNAEALKDFDQIGRYSLSSEAQELAEMANRNAPELKAHDRYGRRVDQVEFHPSYHALMRRSMSYGIGSSVWEDTARGNDNGHLKRAVRFFMLAGLDTGHLSSLSSTNGAVAALMTAPHLAKEWVPRVTTRKYDSAHKSPVDKACLTIGMAIAEKQAGTDFTALTTRAETVGNGLFRLTGHKWFLSSPMADAFLMLARTPNGTSCFLVPRFLADDEHNHINLVGLKNMLGNRSAATAEAEINGSIAQMIGRDGEGSRTIHEMQTLMRLDGAVTSSAIMHASLSEAVHHARHRKVGGRLLIEQPLMCAVLTDVALDVAASTALSMRLARAFDGARSNDTEGAFAHVMTPVVKYLTAKIAPTAIAEAMEAIGGNGYVESSVLPRHYRQAPHHSVLEGSGNMMALEVCRVLKRTPELFNVILRDIESNLGDKAKNTASVLRAAFELAQDDESASRILVEQLAIAAAAAELYRLETGVLADAYGDTRLGGNWRASYGMLGKRFDNQTILDALYPPVT